LPFICAWDALVLFKSVMCFNYGYYILKFVACGIKGKIRSLSESPLDHRLKSSESLLFVQMMSLHNVEFFFNFQQVSSELD